LNFEFFLSDGGNNKRTHKVVYPHFRGNFELRANAIGGADKHRVLEISGFDIEEGTEPPDLTDGARSAGRTNKRPYELDEGIAGVDRDTCLGVS
jgi:hypothetical protein